MDRVKGLSWYNLPLNKDERKLIYHKLDWADWALVRIAHNEKWFNINKRQRLSCICTSKGNIDMLKWSTEKMSYDINYLLIMLEIAAGGGHIHILSYLKNLIDVEIWANSLYAAIYKDQLDVVKWLKKQGAKIDEGVV